MAANTARPDRVLLALSGGVDSSVCARILQQQGFKVEAVVISFSPAHTKAVEAAQCSAQELDIPLSVVHCEQRFEEYVIEPFGQAYASGSTPNPCVNCNPMVKFFVLAEEADKRGIHYIASGHYAQVEEHNGIYYPAVALSTARDQSYMLYRLPQAILSRLCLPVGAFEKPDIRAMAHTFSLTSANSPDSQEICFIPDGDYAAYIQKKGITGKTGRFISPDGEDLGPHKGVLHYTVGQRRGTGLSLGRPVFVKRILENGDIQLGWGGQEYSSGIQLQRVVTTNGSPLQEGEHYLIKIRSAAKPVPCHVSVSQQGETAVITFEEPQRAAAPGQHAVLYQNGLVMGGGQIEVSF